MHTGTDQTVRARLARCEREIAAALHESQKPHTASEQLGILLWEMDWRAEQALLLEFGNAPQVPVTNDT